MVVYASRTRQPKRDTVIVLLSVKAGLRACEIAGLQWSMVMTDNGKLGDVIDIRDTIAKNAARGAASPCILTCNGRWPSCGA
jgi:integrase